MLGAAVGCGLRLGEMDLEETRVLAAKLSRKRIRRRDEDLEQEAWVAGWKVRTRPEGYVVRSIQNRITDYLWGARLGHSRPNHKTVTNTLPLVELDKDEPRALAYVDTYPSVELGWVPRALPPLDRDIVVGLASGLTIAEVARNNGLNPRNVQRHWQRHTRPALQRAWLDNA
mgnify:CR=1 FL=1